MQLNKHILTFAKFIYNSYIIVVIEFVPIEYIFIVYFDVSHFNCNENRLEMIINLLDEFIYKFNTH